MSAPGSIRFDGCGLNDGDGRRWFTGSRADWASETFTAIGTLAAAAPDLYAALCDAVEALRRLPDTEGAYRVTCLTQAEAALKKARG